MNAQSAEHTVGSLGLVLCALAKKNIAIEITPTDTSQAAEFRASQSRLILTSTQVWLPDAASLALSCKEQDTLQLARVAHAAAHLLFSEAGRPTKGLKPMGVAVVSAFEDARVDRLLCTNYPGIRAWFELSIGSQAQTSASYFSSLIEALSRALVLGQTGQEPFWVTKAVTLFLKHERKYGLEDYDGFRRIASIMANDLGQMRVQFNPQQYIVPVLHHDDHSYLWNFEQTGAQPELNESVLTRVQTVGESADDARGSESVASSVARSSYLYPEWNQRANVLRENWCTVTDYASYPLAGENDAQTMSESLYLRPLNLRVSVAERPQTQRQQWQGNELDLDALIDFQASQRRAVGTDPRIFLSQRLRARSLSILLLMDLSASTADLVGEPQISILALQKQAAIELARAARARHDRVAIHGFSSNTRHAVSYHRFLEFDQPLTESVFVRVAQARAEYSTRLGAALRHATVAAGQELSERRVVIVLTDGAPSDIDVFDPDYLIADAAHAVSEARAAGVQTYGLVMDAQAARYTDAVYGLRARQMFEYPEFLPRYLSRLYQQLRR